MTPKYYIGQKVMWDNKIDTLSTVIKINIDDDLETYLYVVDSYREGVGYEEFTEDYLQRPPAKLEYGYCAIGDIVVDKDGDEYMILDVRERLVDLSEMGRFDTSSCAWTYKEARDYGYKIKQEENIDNFYGVSYVERILQDAPPSEKTFEENLVLDVIQLLKDNGYRIVKSA